MSVTGLDASHNLHVKLYVKTNSSAAFFCLNDRLCQREYTRPRNESGLIPLKLSRHVWEELPRLPFQPLAEENVEQVGLYEYVQKYEEIKLQKASMNRSDVSENSSSSSSGSRGRGILLRLDDGARHDFTVAANPAAAVKPFGPDYSLINSTGKSRGRGMNILGLLNQKSESLVKPAELATLATADLSPTRPLPTVNSSVERTRGRGVILGAIKPEPGAASPLQMPSGILPLPLPPINPQPSIEVKNAASNADFQAIMSRSRSSSSSSCSSSQARGRGQLQLENLIKYNAGKYEHMLKNPGQSPLQHSPDRVSLMLSSSSSSSSDTTYDSIPSRSSSASLSLINDAATHVKVDTKECGIGRGSVRTYDSAIHSKSKAEPLIGHSKSNIAETVSISPDMAVQPAPATSAAASAAAAPVPKSTLKPKPDFPSKKSDPKLNVSFMASGMPIPPDPPKFIPVPPPRPAPPRFANLGARPRTYARNSSAMRPTVATQPAAVRPPPAPPAPPVLKRAPTVSPSKVKPSTSAAAAAPPKSVSPAKQQWSKLPSVKLDALNELFNLANPSKGGSGTSADKNGAGQGSSSMLQPSKLVRTTEQGRVLVRTFADVPPCYSLNEIPFEQAIHEALKLMGIHRPKVIQAYVWESILRGSNVAFVAGSQTGKTLGRYLSNIFFGVYFQYLPVKRFEKKT